VAFQTWIPLFKIAKLNREETRSIQRTVTHQYHILPSLGMENSGLILRAFSPNEKKPRQ